MVYGEAIVYGICTIKHTHLYPGIKSFLSMQKLEITIFSTPFDETAVDFLENLNCPMYKIASFEMTDLPLIKKLLKQKSQ